MGLAGRSPSRRRAMLGLAGLEEGARWSVGVEVAAEGDLHGEGAVVAGRLPQEQLAELGLAGVGDAVDLLERPPVGPERAPGPEGGQLAGQRA